MNFLKKMFGQKPKSKYDDIPMSPRLREITNRQDAADMAGQVDGKYHADYVDAIAQMKAEKRHVEAVALLLRLVDAIEQESKISGHGVAPWAYEELAIIHRKEDRLTDEIAILERYFQQKQAPGATPARLEKRLERARELAQK